jgi:ribonuclease E
LTESAAEISVEAETGEQEITGEAVKKKRRRRRKKVAKVAAPSEALPGVEAGEASLTAVAEERMPAEPALAEAVPEAEMKQEPEAKPAKRARKPRKPKAAATTASESGPGEQAIEMSASPGDDGVSMPAPDSESKTGLEAAETNEQIVPSEEKPKRKRAPRKKKETPEQPVD